MAVIVAKAMNHGHHVMARNSDIPFHVLETTYEQYLRLASLLTANDCITDILQELPIFTLYSFDPETLYNAGETPTPEFMRALAERLLQHEDELMTIAQQLEQIGIEKGLQLGEQRGIEKGCNEVR